MADRIIILHDNNMSYGGVLASQAVHLLMLAFCIYISLHSTFWTFISGGIFIIYFVGKLKAMYDNNHYEFYSVEELKKWTEEVLNGNTNT